MLNVFIISQFIYSLNYVLYQCILRQHLIKPVVRVLIGMFYVWLLNISIFTTFPIILFLQRWPTIDYQTIVWGAVVVWNHPVLVPTFIWLI